MSTFTGDATITRADRLSGSINASGGHKSLVIYTVPTGAFAEFYLETASASASFNEESRVFAGPYIIVGGGSGTASPVPLVDWRPSEAILLDEGDQVWLRTQDNGGGGTPDPSTSCSIRFFIIEKNKP